MRTFSTLNAMRQMMQQDERPPTGKYVVNLHDEPELTVRSREPSAFQVDGEYLGETTS